MIKKNFKYYLNFFKYKNFKRFFDLFFAILIIIFLLPLLILISLLIYKNSGFPIIFEQKRPGYKNKIFTLYKFRSMKVIRDKEDKSISDELRLTKFGTWLRSTSMDELPELFNIIKGEMSFVGPRPLLIDYLKFYNAKEMKRHNVKPGITGLAQIKGRNLLSWEDKFNFDVFYVDNRNLFLDFRIILQTIIKVLKREGISPENLQIMKAFSRD